MLGRMTPAGADWSDIYLQQIVSRSWILDEGAVKTGSFSIDRGAGLRTVIGETSTLAYTDVLLPASLLDAAHTVAASAAHAPEGSADFVIPSRLFPSAYSPCCGMEDAASNMHTPASARHHPRSGRACTRIRSAHHGCGCHASVRNRRHTSMPTRRQAFWRRAPHGLSLHFGHCLGERPTRARQRRGRRSDRTGLLYKRTHTPVGSRCCG